MYSVNRIAAFQTLYLCIVPDFFNFYFLCKVEVKYSQLKCKEEERQFWNACGHWHFREAYHQVVQQMLSAPVLPGVKSW